jgi:hypothetical protein
MATVAPAQAQITQIMTPDAAYVGGTALMTISTPDFGTFTSLTDGIVTLTFDKPLQARTRPGSWSTWGSPPDTEGNTVKLGALFGASSILITSDKPLDILGFEAEPDPFSVHPFNVAYSGGAVGAINRNIDGNAGARLLAASTTSSFTMAQLTSDAGFGLARFRYRLAQDVPEPGTYAMLGGLGVSSLTFWLRRRNRKTA